jgi:ubiquinol-cytochrome c reductase cytochrome b subunit
VFASLSNWLDHRTGFRKLISALLIEEIPGGAKWRYVWGSCLVFVFAVQLITGVLLMTAYSAGDSTAWSSVYFIQYEMDFGWFIRGLHHFGSQTMVVLLGIHMLQVVIAGAHLPPREVNWWLGLGLLGTVLGLSLTGYLLPWDQKGYWATKVATNIAGNMPVIGPELSKIIVGGPEYGNHTLTRFYALHIGILPPLTIVLIIAHLVVFRRHGVTAPVTAQGEGWFWPEQAFRDMVVSMLVFGIMLGLVLYGHGPKLEAAPDAVSGSEPEARAGLWDQVAHAGRDGKGANLDAPADPGTESYPARPEWYFLFLFQLLKYFEGPQEIIGTVIIPNGVMILLALLPLLAFGRKTPGGMRTFAHGVSVLVIITILGSAAFLTYQALAADRANQGFQESRADAEAKAERAVNLAHAGIPAEGAVNLLRHDPMTQGPKLFEKNCAVCHNYRGLIEDSNTRKSTASDLANFGSQEWISGFLNDPDSDHYYGRTRFKGGRMSKFVSSARRKDAAGAAADFDMIAEWLATHPRGKSFDDNPSHAKAYKAFQERCADCHKYEGEGGDSAEGAAPDLTGYGDVDWLRLMIVSPDHPARYGLRNRMPGFRDLEGSAGTITNEERGRLKNLLLKDVPEDETKAKQMEKEIDESMRVAHLSDIDRELILRFLIKDNRVVFGGAPISAPPKR